MCPHQLAGVRGVLRVDGEAGHDVRWRGAGDGRGGDNAGGGVLQVGDFLLLLQSPGQFLQGSNKGLECQTLLQRMLTHPSK